MNKIDYLADDDVRQFLEWTGHLVREEWGLRHCWYGKGPRFQCSTLYEAFEKYLWPNTAKGDNFVDTVQRFEAFRRTFCEIGDVHSEADRGRFIMNARCVLGWGRINLPKLNEWATMQPRELQSHITEVRCKLDPTLADTDDLAGFKYMGSGFSKIYSALVPGLPIYDSRVGCAFACLIRLYCKDVGLASGIPAQLRLGVPSSYVPRGGRHRCDSPGIASPAEYARTNLKAAWLLEAIAQNPGRFGQASVGQPVDALQSALFMLGHTWLSDGAVVKPD